MAGQESLQITRQDTDGIRAILGIGALAVDNYPDGNDVGRIWTGNGTTNRALAFKDEVGTGNGSMRSGTTEEIALFTPLYIGEIVYSTTEDRYIYYNNSHNAWKYLVTGETVQRQGHGTGASGVWIETWEDDTTIMDNWVSDDWGTFNNGSSTGKWNRHKNSTGSSNTGPSSAYEGTWYMYSEMSSNGHNTQFNLDTSNFAKLTNLEFRFHMHGSQCGKLRVMTITGGVETEVWTIAGNQGDQWNMCSLDLSTSNAETISIRYEDSTGWQADMAIDQIKITSV